jgi:2-polyprenyl-6-methoxyphenol hydroxylase-like FAD-dependent oxidoreductase
MRVYAQLAMPDAIVVGAGPGGLSTALALQAAGLEPVVLERRPELAEVGSGLTLWPNATDALEQLGVADAVRAVSAPADGIEIRAADGRVLDATGPELMRRHFDSGGITMLRADLQSVLADALGRDRIWLSAGVASVREDRDRVTVVIDDGSTIETELLFGADGVRSSVRSSLFGAIPLRYAGYPVWRAVAPYDLARSVGTLTMGRGAQFGVFPMPRGRVYWFASLNVPEARIAERGALGRDGLLAAFGGWHEPIRAVLEATDPDALVLSPVHDAAPFKQRARGAAALVGDAAHPATPALGQGACQAIEDAVVLGRCIAERHESVTAALRAYERHRVGRTNAMTRQARQLGSIGQWESRVACWLRDRMIEHTPKRARIQQLRWMFKFDLPATEEAQ